jgi:hypothetical protein
MRTTLLAGIATGSLVVFAAQALPSPASQAGGKAPAAYGSALSATNKASPYRPARAPSRAKDYYQSIWGVDHMRVSMTESGSLIRFSYRVTDPVRAQALGDKQATPFLYGQRSHALLHVPVMEKVGPLRQAGMPVAGQEYWMVFSNKGNFVKQGDHVNVVIGSFHADGLMVE